MDMPKVARCEVSQCAYNKDNICHALAITVGDSREPHCDTFFGSMSKGGDPNATAGVGACKMTSCRFNSMLECGAPSVAVGYQGEGIDCLTYAQL